MGFSEIYSFILSYFGIVLLGAGIMLSIALIVPACHWLFISLSVNNGAVAFRRIIVMLTVMYLTFSYLRSPSFYEVAGWWRTTFFATFVIGFMVPALRLDIVRPDRKRDRGIAIISVVWWMLLIFSEALLISGALLQTFILYPFTAVAGILCGSMMGVTVAQTARRKISESAQATGAP